MSISGILGGRRLTLTVELIYRISFALKLCHVDRAVGGKKNIPNTRYLL